MQKIFLHDLSFSPDVCSSKIGKPAFFEWDRVVSQKDKDIVVFTDLCLNLAQHYKNTYNIAYLIEPEVINPNSYKYVLENLDKFSLVLTHHKKFLSISDKIRHYNFGGQWIKPEDHKIYSKNKNMSIIASNKNWAPGHILRHEIINKLKSNDSNAKIDIYGGGYVPIKDKITGIKDYRFHVVIENSREKGYFTEKLVDSFLCGSIPIYWGDPDIYDTFDRDGLFCVSSLDELVYMVDYFSNLIKAEETCNKARAAIENNFKIAQNYLCSEDNIWKSHLKGLFNNE